MDVRSLTKSPSGHVSRRHRTSEPFSRRYRKSERIEPECNTDNCSYQNGIDDRYYVVVAVRPSTLVGS